MKSKESFPKLKKRLQNREESIDKRHEVYEKKLSEVEVLEKELDKRGLDFQAKQEELDSVIEQAKGKIEEIAEMSREDAKQELVNIVEYEARHESAKKLKQIEEDLNKSAEEKAKKHNLSCDAEIRRLVCWRKKLLPWSIYQVMI